MAVGVLHAMLGPPGTQAAADSGMLAMPHTSSLLHHCRLKSVWPVASQLMSSKPRSRTPGHSPSSSAWRPKSRSSCDN